MTNEVIWTKLVLERFIQLANLTEEEEIVIRTRAAGWSRVKQAMELNISISGIDRIINTDDERQRAGGFDVFEMPQNFNGGRKRGGIHAGKPARKEPGWALERVEA